MLLEPTAVAAPTARRWRWLIITTWAIVVAVLVCRLFISQRLHSVYPIFADAARCWSADEEMYWPYHSRPDLDLYRYSPAVAQLLQPFAGLTDRSGCILWLLVSAGSLIAALTWWTRVALPRALGTAHMAALWLIILAFAAGNLHNGQANTLVAAFLLAAAAGACTERWMVVSVCLAGATLFKVYPLAFGLLLLLIYPRKLAIRLPAAIVLGLAIPFLFKPGEYVLREYQHWIDVVRLDDRRTGALTRGYHDLWLLLRLTNVPVSVWLYSIAQGIGALAAAGVCLWGKWSGLAARPLVMLGLGMATLWMMILGPATESSTYLLVAPTFAWTILDALNARARRFETGLLLVSAACFLTAMVALWFAPYGRLLVMTLQPTGALTLLGAVALAASREFRAARVTATNPAPPQIGQAA